jgi:hypothetical protein
MASVRVAAAFCMLSCFCAASAHGQDEAHSKLSAFVAVGQDLYSRAAIIVGKGPTTESDIDHIDILMGNQWHIDEHAFQISFSPIATEQVIDLPTDVQEGMLRIEQFDNFIFNAVGASYICHNADARWTLNIAGELLAHAKMASDGHPDLDWDPDLDSEPKDQGTCRK